MNPIAQALRRQGYKGSLSDADAVRAFVNEQNLEIQSGEKALTLDEIVSGAAKKVTISVSKDDEEVEINAPEAPAAEGMGGEMPEEPKSAPKPKTRAVERIVAAPFRADVQDRLNTKAAYRNRAKRFGVGGGDSQVAFSDPDMAEAFGAWYRSVAMAGKSYPQRQADLEILRKTSITSDLSLGGAFVPDEFRPDLIEIFLEYGAARQLAGVVSMNGDLVKWPRLNSDVTAYWGSEAEEMTESDFGSDLVQLSAQELYAFHRVSNFLLSDSAVEIASLAARSMSRAITAKEDQAYFNGDGTSTYGGHVGIIGKFTTIGTNPEDAAGLQLASGDTWDEIKGTDIDKMLGKLYQWGGLGQVQMACHSKFYWQVLVPLMDRSELAATNTTVNTAGVPARTFRGIHVVFSNVMQVNGTGTSGRDTVPLLAGDFGLGTKFGEVRGGVQVESSSHAGFSTNTTLIRSVERVAINCHDIGDGTTPGPVVGLIMEDA